MDFGRSILDNWYLDKDINFLNPASCGTTPKQVMAKGHVLEKQMEAEPLRFFLEEYPDMIRQSAEEIGKFIGADGIDIALVENTTSGINCILQSLLPSFSSGDEILVTGHLYPAINNSLKHWAGIFGVNIIMGEVPFPIEDKAQVVEAVKSKLSLRTRLAIIDHITAPTALIFPVEEIISLCHNKDIPVVIDGAHVPGMLPIDLNLLDADYYVGNCHKWLFAQKGCSIMWTKKEYQKLMHPAVISNNYGKGYTEEFDWIGTRNPVSWLSLPEAISFHRSFGSSRLMNHNRDLVLEAGAMLNKRFCTKATAPPDMTGSILALEMPGNIIGDWNTTHELRKEFLKRFKTEIMFTPFNNKIYYRIAAQAFNEMEDFEKLADAIAEYIK